MPQDAFHIRRLASELDSMLAGGRVNRVSQADKDELALIIYTEKGALNPQYERLVCARLRAENGKASASCGAVFLHAAEETSFGRAAFKRETGG